MPAQPPTLRQALSLPLIVLYGLGTTPGTRIYPMWIPVAGALVSAAMLVFALTRPLLD